MLIQMKIYWYFPSDKIKKIVMFEKMMPEKKKKRLSFLTKTEKMQPERIGGAFRTSLQQANYCFSIRLEQQT